MLLKQALLGTCLAITASAYSNYPICGPAASSCAYVPAKSSASCAKIIASKGRAYSTCDITKTAKATTITKTVIVKPTTTIYQNQISTVTVEETTYGITETETLTGYTTTLILENASLTTTETDILSYTESDTVTDTLTATQTVFALDKRAKNMRARASCTSIPDDCSCFLTRSMVKSLFPKSVTKTTTVHYPAITKTAVHNTQTIVTDETTETTTLITSETDTISSYSTDTITATETTQTSVTSTATETVTAMTTIKGCASPNDHAICGSYCFNIAYDYYNCGGCGQACRPGQICGNYACH